MTTDTIDPINSHPAVVAAQTKLDELNDLRTRCVDAIQAARTEIAQLDQQLTEAASAAARASLLGQTVTTDDAPQYARLDSTRRRLEVLERELHRIDADIISARGELGLAYSLAQKAHADACRAEAQALLPELYAVLDRLAATGAVGQLYLSQLGDEGVHIESGLAQGSGVTKLQVLRRAASVAWSEHRVRLS